MHTLYLKIISADKTVPNVEQSIPMVPGTEIKLDIENASLTVMVPGKGTQQYDIIDNDDIALTVVQ